MRSWRLDSTRLRPVLLLLAAATLWGAIGPVAGFAFRAGMAPLEVAFWRAALAAPLFVALGGRRMRPAAGELAGMALFGLLGIAGMYGGFFVAARTGGAPLAATLLYTGPAWVALYERRVRGRALGAAGVLGVAASLTGVAVLTGVGGGAAPPLLAILAGLGSGLAFATHFILAPRYLDRFGAPFVFAVAMTCGALALLPFARPALPTGAALPALAFIVIGSTLLASICFGRAVVHLAPVRASVLATWEPVVATLLAWSVWSTSIGGRQLLGAGLIVGAAALVALRPAPTPAARTA